MATRRRADAVAIAILIGYRMTKQVSVGSVSSQSLPRSAV
jgi:hypothetical protein